MGFGSHMGSTILGSGGLGIGLRGLSHRICEEGHGVRVVDLVGSTPKALLFRDGDLVGGKLGDTRVLGS